MEKRVIVAIVLSILVLVLWQAFFVKSPQRNPAAEQTAQGQAPVTVPMGKPIPRWRRKPPGNRPLSQPRRRI